MQLDAVILGASGYGGGELIRWLAQHPKVSSLRGTSRSLAGKPFAEAHPNLRGIVEENFVAAVDWRELSKSAQPVVFSALPHGELAKLLPALEEEWQAAGLAKRLLLLDLSADFRASADFVYGMPEWNRAALAHAKRVACPGCFATALQIALLPLRDLEVGFIAASAVTGSSGSGMAASAGTHHPTRAHDLRAYKVLTHQHLAEVRMAMRSFSLRGQLSFVPQSGPFVRGIFATVQFALPPDLSETQLRERAGRVFADAPFIRMVETSPRVAAVTGSNFADVSLAVAEGGAAILVALDNLGKGMAGQAVQAMNLALGLPEGTGLRVAGRFPG